jgi:ATP-dependent protease HslVU (ClpYQ) peptidase subunit
LGKKDNQDFGGSFLVGHKDRLFCIHGDFQVAEQTDGYDAVGCGEDIAKGALFASKKHNKLGDAEGTVRTALEAAEGYSAGVRGPFKILFMESGQ